MKTFKLINTLILISLIIINIFYIGNNIINGKFVKLLDNGLLFLSLLTPFLSKKIIKINLSELFKFFYYIYIIISLLIGEIMLLMKDTLWFDKIVHFYFGFIISIVAVLIIKYNSNNLKEKIFFNILFISGFALLAGSNWELIEFTLDKVFHTNHQRWIETCVDDTMLDLLVTFLGSIIINICYYIEIKKNKFGLVYHSIRDDVNI